MEGAEVDDYLLVFLQHDLLPSLLLVSSLEVGLDHHLHLLLTNLSSKTKYYYFAGAGVSHDNPRSAICFIPPSFYLC